jgi:hypothetical protein
MHGPFPFSSTAPQYSEQKAKVNNLIAIACGHHPVENEPGASPPFRDKAPG